jgi:hypothetical protein
VLTNNDILKSRNDAITLNAMLNDLITTLADGYFAPVADLPYHIKRVVDKVQDIQNQRARL